VIIDYKKTKKAYRCQTKAAAEAMAGRGKRGILRREWKPPRSRKTFADYSDGWYERVKLTRKHGTKAVYGPC